MGKTQLKPWEKKESEGNRAYELFRVYASIPPEGRTLASVEKIAECSEQLVKRYSAAWNWLDRARAWDIEKQRAVDETVLTELEKTTRDQLRTLANARELASIVIGEHLEDVKEFRAKGESVRETVDIRMALQLLKESVTLERLLMGEATERVGIIDQVHLDLTPLDQQEAETLLYLLTKIGAFQ